MFDSPFHNDSKGNGINYWKGRKIVPLSEWHKIANCNEAFTFGIRKLKIKEALQYFPDDYYLRSPFPFGVPEEFEEKASKWYYDYLELMEYRRNPKYGRTKCFHCLLSPDGDDPIFIGINRLVAKGLTKEQENGDNDNNMISYPCEVANRFECPYDYDYDKQNDKDAKFNACDLFELKKMALAVETALSEAEKDTSAIQIRNKQDLYHALTDKETFKKILKQGLNKEYQEYKDGIVDYFMNIKDKVKLEELRFYPSKYPYI